MSDSHVEDRFLGIGIAGYGTEFKGIGGRIKERPEDFVVAEVLAEEARRLIRKRGEGYPLYVMSKWNTDILSAKKTVEGAVKSKVNILGLKDKRAVTHQFVSSRSRTSLRDNWSGGGVKVVHRKDTSRPLTRRELFGNAFDIRISDCLSDNEALVLTKHALENSRIPNFFGMQRFGSVHPNHIVGKYIVKREFAKASALVSDTSDQPLKALRQIPLKVRRLYVSAYQSYLFNRCLSRLLSEGSLPQNTENEVLLEFDRNLPRVGSSFVTHGTNSKDKCFVQMCPVPGYSFRSRENLYWKAMEEVLKEEGVSPKDFFVKELQEVSAEGGLRPASMIGWLKGWRLEDSTRVRFILYKGEFATILLRELIKDGPTNQI
ncbi:MAG: tRNA pseudouridine(13) synthase TruD [Nitrososphaerota archaeon]|jgi:tRNA pseudouridine13 synthase|nr:tRNA pseudouridine(13) synthase TruD [Nitrososphaerota archaeon]